jgi:hypothetical protein
MSIPSPATSAFIVVNWAHAATGVFAFFNASVNVRHRFPAPAGALMVSGSPYRFPATTAPLVPLRKYRSSPLAFSSFDTVTLPIAHQSHKKQELRGFPTRFGRETGFTCWISPVRVVELGTSSETIAIGE